MQVKFLRQKRSFRNLLYEMVPVILLLIQQGVQSGEWVTFVIWKEIMILPLHPNAFSFPSFLSSS